MIARTLALLILFIPLVGCARQMTEQERLLLGEWKATKNLDDGTDWASLSRTRLTVRFKTESKMDVWWPPYPEDTLPGGFIGWGQYQLRDGWLTMTLDQKSGTMRTGNGPYPASIPPPTLNLKFKASVTADTLTLTDDQGNVQTFTRVAPGP